MLEFVSEMLMMVSAGAVVYLIARAMPRVSDEEPNAARPSGAPHPFIVYVERVDERILSFAEKLLRRARVVLLKLDNAVTTKLNRFKKEQPKEPGFPVEPPKKNDLNGTPPTVQ